MSIKVDDSNTRSRKVLARAKSLDVRLLKRNWSNGKIEVWMWCDALENIRPDLHEVKIGPAWPVETWTEANGYLMMVEDALKLAAPTAGPWLALS